MGCGPVGDDDLWYHHIGELVGAWSWECPGACWKTQEPAGKALELAGRVSEQGRRALEPAGRALEPAKRASEPAGRALEPAERASEPAGRALEPAGRVSEPAGRPQGETETERKKNNGAFIVCGVIVPYGAAAQTVS